MDKIKTLNELAKENPDKTYNELTRIQEDTKLKKEGVCVTGALKKDLQQNRPLTDTMDERAYYELKNENQKLRKRVHEAEGEMTIVKGIGMSSPEMKEAQQKIKELETILRSQDYTKHHDYKFLVDENKKLHKEVDELKLDNKRLAHHIEDRVDRSRKAGL